jgi:hypothetical protein
LLLKRLDTYYLLLDTVLLLKRLDTYYLILDTPSRFLPACRRQVSFFSPAYRRPLRLCVFASHSFFFFAQRRQDLSAERQDPKDLMRVGKDEKKSQPLNISSQKNSFLMQPKTQAMEA